MDKLLVAYGAFIFLGLAQVVFYVTATVKFADDIHYGTYPLQHGVMAYIIYYMCIISLRTQHDQFTRARNEELFNTGLCC